MRLEMSEDKKINRKRGKEGGKGRIRRT